ncbi:acyl-coenzyme A thioesterase THEM4 [Microcaecilia unicolor]|uniref:Acyl-coenzyme A thioesterase THEM4 n=1 Tax=Microcaecilia unicolor TaxID=1415580 RepID=A0A6P7WR70_9AMPH|nr:acyl-coenzyme A thioesterase THEM4-like [Microcaecilia unicolor]XP_030043652.1 acyl-coenzyme A thioesterase THEM4-like [Microcaecilia unicolor]XP_030043653.1 acyl-coenzyme A thioesterase THEM4-like [Microcaecilia unicolor]
MFRCSVRLIKGLTQITWLREQPVLPNLLYRRSVPAAYLPSRALRVTWPCAEEVKDFSLPNPSWSQNMRNLYNKYMELSQQGSWIRLPSYNVTATHLIGKAEQCPDSAKPQVTTRLFTRNLDVEGLGFEYVMFYNQAELRTVGIFQAGPYLEGPIGLTHGGAIATIVDTTSGACAICTLGKVKTANLNINYRSPITLGSTVEVQCRVDKIEGRKIFMSTEIRSADSQVLHIEATALFIQMKMSE